MHTTPGLQSAPPQTIPTCPQPTFIRLRDSRRTTEFQTKYQLYLYWSVLYCTVRCTVMYCTVQCCTVLYSAVLYCTILYGVLYCTVLAYWSCMVTWKNLDQSCYQFCIGTETDKKLYRPGLPGTNGPYTVLNLRI